MSSEIVKRLTSNDFKTEISDVTRLKFRVHAFLILTAAINWMIDFHLTVRFYPIRFDFIWYASGMVSGNVWCAFKHNNFEGA